MDFRQLNFIFLAHFLLHFINKLEIIFEIPGLLIETFPISLRFGYFKSFIEAAISSLGTFTKFNISTSQNFS